MQKPIDPSAWYTAREAADLLNRTVTEATIKKYCKSGELVAKRAGPKSRWMIQGKSLVELRKKWLIV